MSGKRWIDIIEPGDRVFIGSNVGVPTALCDELVDNAQQFHDVEIVHILTQGENRWALPKYCQNFKVNTFFIGGETVRDAVREGRADYTPVFMSEASKLFRTSLPIDVALIMVSPPDEQGYCSCGVSVDVTHSAARYAKYTVAQINQNMPRTYGNAFLHMDDFDLVVHADQAIFEVPPSDVDQVSRQIGQYISLLVEDESCLQIGIGKIPDAALSFLTNHKNLGVHTEILTDGIMKLMREGVINNQKKIPVILIYYSTSNKHMRYLR